MRFINYLVYLLLFLIPLQTRLILRPGNGWEYATLGMFGTELLIWLIALLYIVKMIRSKEQRARSKTVWPFVLCSLFFVLFTSTLLNIFFVASDRLIAIQQIIHLLEAGILFWILAGGQINRLTAIYAFLAGLSLQAVLATYQFLSQSTFGSRLLGLTLHEAAVGGTSVVENLGGRWLRAYGGLPHPNILGGYMALGIVLIVLALQCFSLSRRQKYLLWLVGALLSTALFFTFSRGAWLALFISLLVYWFIDLKNKKIFQSFSLLIFGEIALIFVILSLMFAPLLSSRLTGQGRLESQAISERLGGYGEAWALFKKHPLLGVGAGNYTAAIYRELDSSREPWAYQPVHNSFLLAFVELGVVGIGLIVLIFYKRARSKEQGARQFGHLFFVLCSLFFVLGLFDHYLWSLYSGLILVSVGAGLTFRGIKVISVT